MRPRLEGRLVFMSQSRGRIRGDDKYDYYFFKDDLEYTDNFGHKDVFLNTRVNFEVKNQLHAIDIRYEDIPFDDTPMPSDYRDDAVVSAVREGGRSGFATRSSGETVFFHTDDVVTWGYELLSQVGTQFRFYPSAPKPGNRYFGCRSIEIYKPTDVGEETYD